MAFNFANLFTTIILITLHNTGNKNIAVEYSQINELFGMSQFYFKGL